jgi:hypothetical protein
LGDQLHQLQKRLTSPTTPPESIPLIKEEIQFRKDLEKLRHALKLEQKLSELNSPAKPGQRPPDAKLK